MHGNHRDHHHRSHLLLGKRNNLPREVFCWLVAGEKTASFFSRQKSPKCALGGGGAPRPKNVGGVISAYVDRLFFSVLTYAIR